VVKAMILRTELRKRRIFMAVPEVTVVRLSLLDLPGVRFVSLMVVLPPQFLVRHLHQLRLLVFRLLL
jgi:hypothetical protein